MAEWRWAEEVWAEGELEAREQSFQPPNCHGYLTGFGRSELVAHSQVSAWRCAVKPGKRASRTGTKLLWATGSEGEAFLSAVA